MPRTAGEVPITIDGTLHDIDIVWVDSRSTPPASAVNAATDAIIRQNVKLMIGGWHSSVALALMDAEADLNTIHIGHLGGASQYIAAKINDDPPQRYRGWFKGLALAAETGWPVWCTSEVHAGTRALATGQ